jgi:hypothetical protein
MVRAWILQGNKRVARLQMLIALEVRSRSGGRGLHVLGTAPLAHYKIGDEVHFLGAHTLVTWLPPYTCPYLSHASGSNT